MGVRCWLRQEVLIDLSTYGNAVTFKKPSARLALQGVFSLGVRAWLILACLAMTGCTRSTPSLPFIGVEIGPQAVAGEFHLTDHLGHARSMADFRGKLVVLFFGYTHCPDVCPTTLHDLAQAMKLLGSRRSEAQVLFVTVDPERDTQQVLAKYVPSFDPEFIGLSGDAVATSTVLKNFHVFASRQPGLGKKSAYSVDHSAGIYVFDRLGMPRLYLNYGQKPADIAHDFRLLLP